ncbi:signal peptidase I [Candidatus Saccharibacteria bacterium]|nr:signal peptidase I [Candidatus Saccharibacteria bacterium]
MKGGVASRSNLIKVALLSLVMLLAVLACTLKFSLFHQTSLWYLGFLVISLGVSWLLVGFRPKKSSSGRSATQIVLIYTLFFLLLIYVLGLVTGFLRNAYSLEPLAILKNTLPVIGIVVMQELLRYSLVKRIGSSLRLFTILVVSFSIMSIAVGLSSYSLGLPLAVFEFVGRLVLGSLAVNLMLTFVSWKSDFRPAIVYALIMSLYPMLIPIIPDLGAFIYSVLAIVLPMLLFMRFNELFETRRALPARYSRAGEWIAAAPILIVLGTVVILVSGIFRYWAMAVGSSSMSPNLNMGDAAIIDQNYGDASQIEPGSILAFRHDGQIIVHRVTDVKNLRNGCQIQTQGDANAKEDAWTVSEDDIVGVVRWYVPFIGWPTVWITQAL